MKNIINVPLILFLLLPAFLKSQSAPVTIASNVLSHGPDLSVTIKVRDFIDIGSLSLALTFDPTVVQINSIIPNSNLPGFLADWTTIPGKLIIGWFGSAGGVNLPDNSEIAVITFTGLTAGQTALTWINDSNSCQYSRFNGGLFTTLNNIPFQDYFINGSIKYWRSAPVTIAPVIASIPGTLCIPIRIEDFNNISSIALTLDFNPGALTFQSITSVSIPGTWSIMAQSNIPGRMVFGAFGPVITSIPDNEILFYACFTYHGGTSYLAWSDNGTSCEYSDETITPLWDENSTYLNGVVIDSIFADFSANNLTPPKFTNVIFTDETNGSPTSWKWKFNRPSVNFMEQTTANSQNPVVQFTEGGLYTVTLEVQNLYTGSSITKTGYIRAGSPGLWTGSASATWNTPSNWDNWLVPDQFIDVLIPANAAKWPVYNGDMTIGIHCKSLTLESVNCELTITGNLTN